MDYKDKDYFKGGAQEHFWFKAKADLISILLSKVSNNKSCTILDVGAGSGDDLNVIKNFGAVYALDCEQRALDLISDHAVYEKKLGDVCAMPYADKQFDIVVAFDLLEHIPDHVQAVKEINRVLKPGGYFVITVPSYNSLFSQHDRELGHVRRYNKKLLAQLMQGFEQNKRGYWLCAFFIPAIMQHFFIRNHAGLFKVRLFNSLAYGIMSAENWLIKRNVPLPWGLSLFGIYQKKL